VKFIGPPSSGSIAATVFSRNRGGQYTRARSHPSQPAGSGRPATVRANLTTASQTWATISAPQQRAWDVYAKAHPVTDSLGQLITLTGQMAFIRNACNRLNMGALLSTTPPSDSRVFRALPFGFTVTGGGSILVTPAGNGGLTDNLLISMGKPTTTGRRAWFAWEQIVVQPGNSNALYDATGNYTIFFPSPVSGQRIFCRVIPVSQFGVRGLSLQQFADMP
jgi:hypothetical protein